MGGDWKASLWLWYRLLLFAVESLGGCVDYVFEVKGRNVSVGQRCGLDFGVYCGGLSWIVLDFC